MQSQPDKLSNITDGFSSRFSIPVCFPVCQFLFFHVARYLQKMQHQNKGSPFRNTRKSPSALPRTKIFGTPFIERSHITRINSVSGADPFCFPSRVICPGRLGDQYLRQPGVFLKCRGLSFRHRVPRRQYHRKLLPQAGPGIVCIKSRDPRRKIVP